MEPLLNFDMRLTGLCGCDLTLFNLHDVFDRLCYYYLGQSSLGRSAFVWLISLQFQLECDESEVGTILWHVVAVCASQGYPICGLRG